MIFDRMIIWGRKWVLYDNSNNRIKWLSQNKLKWIFTKLMLASQKGTFVCLKEYPMNRSFWIVETLTICTDFYWYQLNRVNYSSIEKLPTFNNRKSIVLQYDNARGHCGRKNIENINVLWWEILPHLLYSPDTADSDLNLLWSA